MLSTTKSTANAENIFSTFGVVHSKLQKIGSRESFTTSVFTETNEQLM